MKAYRGRRVVVHLFVILLLDGGEGVPHALGALPPGKGPRCPLNVRLVASQSHEK